MTFKAVDREAAVHDIVSAVQWRSNRIFAFCNAHTFNLARRSPELAAVLSSATVFNDGAAIDLASRILFGGPFPDNLNGTDLMPAVFAALDRPTSVFLVGSPPGIAEKAAEALQRRWPFVRIVGSHDGFFTAADGPQLTERIRDAKTDLLLLGMGNPRQELWAAEIKARTGAVIMCVGAFLDFASGRVLRAPRPVQAMRLEWAYRLAHEPLRLCRRYVGGAAPFLLAVLTEKYGRPKAGGQPRPGGEGDPRPATTDDPE